jgi:uncharacterized Zn finger protein
MNKKNQKDFRADKIQNGGLWARSIQTCRGWAARCGQLREKLMARLAEEANGQISESLVRQALTEADALASSTQYPLLFLPVLAEEKISNARQWAGRQRAILERQKALGAMR